MSTIKKKKCIKWKQKENHAAKTASDEMEFQADGNTYSEYV
jgi:hypothetical protein